MPIKVKCGKCGTVLKVPDGSAGKQAKCTQCGTLFKIPNPGAPSPAAPPNPATPVAPAPPAPTPAPSPTPPASGGFPSIQTQPRSDRLRGNAPNPAPAPAPTPAPVESKPPGVPALNTQGAPPQGVPPMGGPPQVPANNPYTPPAAGGAMAAPAGGGQGLQAVAPLHQAAGWMNLAGWCMIIFGAIYSLGIVTLIVSWVPIWLGICLKNAGTALKQGGLSEPAVFKATSNLKTYFTILGIMVMIGLIMFALVLLMYLVLFIIGMIAVGTAGSGGFDSGGFDPSAFDKY